ncbi:MAG: hypothetical protein PUB22_07865, partial [Clostridiales bacterium]|nr:hypothetical protein [Clostridiales bacterium]
MKKKSFWKKLISSALSCSMVLSMAAPAYANPVPAVTAENPTVSVSAEAVDFDSITSLAIDYSQAAQLPLTGYFTKSVLENRSVKVYIAGEAQVRSYITVVAVPNGVKTDEFLESTGWFAKAEERGECLFVLEPGEGGWGTVEEEKAYMDAAIAFLKSCRNSSNIGVFSTFGEYYLVGYGEGAAPLEAWAAQNPIFVIAQTYLDGAGQTAEYLAPLSESFYTGDYSANNYMSVEIPEEDLIARSEVPVPTWLVNYGADSTSYWKNANDCVETAAADETLGSVFAQAEDSDSWMTSYCGPISKVAVKEGEVVYNADLTEEICEFMYGYTRYDNTSAYGNALAQRINFTEAAVAARKEAMEGKAIETFRDEIFGVDVDVLGRSDVKVEGHGTVQVGILNYVDKNGDGTKDPREYILYVPDGFEGKKLPVLYVWAGNSQTDNIFFDCTQWWNTAEQEGIVLVFPCETYSSATGVSHANNQETYAAIRAMLEETVDGVYADLDYSRIYTTGQSAGGSGVSFPLCASNPEDFAAAACTSGTTDMTLEENSKPMPAMSLVGEGEDANRRAGDLWDDKFNTLDSWAAYFLTVNGFQGDVNAFDDVINSGRQQFHIWNNEQGIPLVIFGKTAYRAHNCIPEEIPMLWSYLEHFSYEVMEDGTINRYYSSSCFEQDDKVLIAIDEAAPTEQDLQDQVVSIDSETIPNFYGQRLSEAVITFAEGTDMAAVEAADVAVWDRGSMNPQFGEVPVVSSKVAGNQLILTFDQGSAKVTDRSRNTFGLMSTASWYFDEEGNIFSGSEDSTDVLGNVIHANKTRKGYQPRQNLDLILTINSDITEGMAMTDGRGNMLDDTVWNPTVNEAYDEIELISVNPGWEAEGYDLVTENGDVPVHVIWPEGYDKDREEKYPVVFYVTGGGTSYWQLTDTSVDGVLAPAHNLGDNIAFDNMVTRWAEEYPEAIIISPNVHSGDKTVSAKEVIGVLEAFVRDYNADAEKIIGVGNSFGTQIISDVIRLRPDLIAAFVSNNGRLGVGVAADSVDGTWENSAVREWTSEEIQAMIDNEVAIWMLNGETDSAHPRVTQDIFGLLSKDYAAAGHSEEWINDHVHISGIQSWKFKAWGETDHSVTKMTAFYYLSKPYLDVWEGQEDLKPGDKYTLAGKEDTNYYGADEFEYVAYEETVAEWAINVVNGVYEEKEDLQSQVVSIDSETIPNFYGQRLSEAVITFAEGTDMAAVEAADVAVWDRGSMNPQFGEVPVVSSKVAGNQL